MKIVPIEHSAQPFEIEVKELSDWQKRPHRHNFFELVYVESGEGEQCINHYKHLYKRGSIFLLPPWDCHSFTVYTTTRFAFIRFTGLYFGKNGQNLVDYSEWFRQLHYVLSSYNKIPGEIIKNEEDKKQVELLVRSVMKEYANRDKYSDNIIRSNMVSILNILTRSVERNLIQSASDDAHFGYILSYVQHNLYNKENIRLSALAKQFNIAPTYFGEYFKRHAGESLQDYIIKSKLRVAEARIVHANQSLKETAFELGFTDSSHLSKMLRKYSNTSVIELKKRKAVTCS